MSVGAVVAGLAALAAVGLPLAGLWWHFEEKRRAREAGTPARGAGTAALRAGLLEAQNLLEPERRIDAVREEERTRDLVVRLDEEGEPPH